MDFLFVSEFFKKVTGSYWPAYYAWLSERLENTEPFAVLMGAVILIFLLVVYLWWRNKDA